MPEQIAKNIQSGNDQEPVPVLIWIHGGAFFLGSNRDEYVYSRDLLISYGLNCKLYRQWTIVVPRGAIQNHVT